MKYDVLVWWNWILGYVDYDEFISNFGFEILDSCVKFEGLV